MFCRLEDLGRHENLGLQQAERGQAHGHGNGHGHGRPLSEDLGLQQAGRGQAHGRGSHQVALTVGTHACSIHLHCRYLKKMLEAGKRNGLGLEGDDLEELKLVQRKISELGIAFKLCLIIIIFNLQNPHHCLNLASGLVWTRTLLTSGWRKKILLEFLKILSPLSSGVPLGSWRCQHDKHLRDILLSFQVTLQYPHYIPVIERCSVPETRYKINKVKMCLFIRKMENFNTRFMIVKVFVCCSGEWKYATFSQLGSRLRKPSGVGVWSTTPKLLKLDSHVNDIWNCPCNNNFL